LESHRTKYLLEPHQAINLRDVFNQERVVLEIGCGFGEATVAMATVEPDVGIIALEVHTRGVARLLQNVDAAGLTNIRVANTDAVPFVRDCIAPLSLDGARIFFPDPWPKARHNKRRLIQPEFASLLASKLAPGAFLHCATDWQPYAEHMLEVLTASADFTNTTQNYLPRPDWRPLTRYEQAGLDKGHAVFDLLFIRHN
jgi:tRNA (guanine-N7-)-methyltransferase